MVERGPEKAGVGGSIPSLATIIFNNLTRLKKRLKISRAYNTRTLVTSDSTFGAARSNFSCGSLAATFFLEDQVLASSLRFLRLTRALGMR